MYNVHMYIQTWNLEMCLYCNKYQTQNVIRQAKTKRKTFGRDT